MSVDSAEDVRSFVNVIREMIRHEDTILNHRLTWMWTLQGLLFAAAGVLWDKDKRGVVIMGVVGILSCVSIGYSLSRGLRAVKELLGLAASHKRHIGEGVELPPTIGARTKAIEWLLPGRLLPWVFGLAWASVIVLRLFLTPASK
jgi:hypothetical protein